MKRFCFVFISFFFSLQIMFSFSPNRNLAGKNSLIVITEESDKKQLELIDKINDEINIFFVDNYDFTSKSNQTFLINLIESLHSAYSQGINVTIEGNFEYIYANGNLSKNLFIEIKDKIKNASNKNICVDLSDCYFISNNDQKNLLLPKNCFSNELDICWLYLGDMIESFVPENFCYNCKNLKGVFMWNESNFLPGAFDNVHEDAVIIDKNLEIISLKKYKEKYFIEDLSYWDYSDLQNDNIEKEVSPNLTDNIIETDSSDENLLEEVQNTTETSVETDSVSTDLIESEDLSKTINESEGISKTIEESDVISETLEDDDVISEKLNESDSIPEENLTDNSILVTEKEKIEDEIAFEKKPKSVDTGVVWLIDSRGNFQRQKKLEEIDDFGIYDYINDDDFLPLEKSEFSDLPKLEELFEDVYNPDFRSLENTILIDNSNADFYEVKYPKKDDPNRIAEIFLASYLLQSENYKKYIDFDTESVAQLEINLDSENSHYIKEYSNIKIYLLNDVDRNDINESLVFFVEGEINGEIIKDISLLKMKRYGDSWYVMNIYNGWYGYYLSNIDANK